ncbi:MAG: hypothetical protein LUE17_09760 [Planctomycetaceae bacterium]|nr:hypothetical protein [Planctomycetaceae bacterium]
MGEKVDYSKVITFAGAIVAYLIGSAFATDQEVMQFFTNFGVWQSIGALILGLIVMIYLACTLMKDGRKLMLKNPADIYAVYGGKFIGIFVKVFSAIYLYCLYVLMLSGAGTVMHEYYGLNRWTGSVILMIGTLIVVLLGLKRMVSVLGRIGPVIIVVAVAVGFINFIMYAGNVPAADAFLASVEPPPLKASSSWIISGVLNGTAATILMVPFLAGMGTEASSRKEAILGGSLGGFLFIFGAGAINMGLLACMEQVYHLQAPALGMADNIIPGLGVFYSVVVVLGIFTTAVPLLWAPFMTLEADEKSVKFRAMVIIGAFIALFGGQLHFSVLINIIIPIAGWVGILISLCVLYRHITGSVERSAANFERQAPTSDDDDEVLQGEPQPAMLGK